MTDLTDIKTLLGEDWIAVSALMSKSLSSDIRLLDRTNANLLAHSGKQLRPMLGLLAARACSGGKVTEDTLHYAAAAEILHNATLLHDDVADDSDERRGRPTIKALMGASISVLFGDYWLVRAMDLILNSPSGGKGVMSLFSSTLANLAEGEILQLQKASEGDTTERDYFRIIYNKTACLFEATVRSAARSVHASEEYENAVSCYASKLGLAFQIKDDILDYAGDSKVGKPLGVDILEQKITMPLLGALSQVSEEENNHIRHLVTDINSHPEYKDEIMRFVAEHDGVGFAKKRLATCIEEAVRCLDVLPDSKEKETLIGLAGFVAWRNS